MDGKDLPYLLYNQYVQRLQNVLGNICELLGLGSDTSSYVLEASFTGLEINEAMKIDLGSWKDLVPHIKVLCVSKR